MTESVAAHTARVVAEAARAGAFGPGARSVSYEPDARHAGAQDQFASTLRFGTVTVRQDGDGGEPVGRGVGVVLKFKHRVAELRTLFLNDAQFHNETLFYGRIAPYLLDRVPAAAAADDDRIPPLCRYFYGRNDCGDRVLDDVIVLGNAADLGYRMSDERLHLDFDHLAVALRTLAK